VWIQREILAAMFTQSPVQREFPHRHRLMEDIVALRNAKSMSRKRQLSPKELKQLSLWGLVLFILFLGLVYFLVSTGAIIPGTSGITRGGGGVVSTGATNAAK
jgi:hypothetical protein